MAGYGAHFVFGSGGGEVEGYFLGGFVVIEFDLCQVLLAGVFAAASSELYDFGVVFCGCQGKY